MTGKQGVMLALGGVGLFAGYRLWSMYSAAKTKSTTQTQQQAGAPQYQQLPDGTLVMPPINTVIPAVSTDANLGGTQSLMNAGMPQTYLYA